MKLRADMMKKQGAAFSLQEFHDDFLARVFRPLRSFAKQCWEMIHPLCETREGHDCL